MLTYNENNKNIKAILKKRATEGSDDDSTYKFYLRLYRASNVPSFFSDRTWEKNVFEEQKANENKFCMQSCLVRTERKTYLLSRGKT
jgi:hypothetical protein